MITGSHKNRVGTIDRFVGRERVIIPGVNVVKKAKRQNREGEPAGIVDQDMPIHISNIAIVNTQTNKADKVIVKTEEDGSKQRVFKSTGEPIEVT